MIKPIATLPDNDLNVISSIISSIRYSDPDAYINNKRNVNLLLFSVKPSEDRFKPDIIQNLVSLHRLLHLKVIFSKSLKVAKTITFSIDLGDSL